MSNYHKWPNPNIKRIVLLFVFQIVLGVTPVVLSLIFALRFSKEYPWLAFLFIAAILICGSLDIVITQRYKILASGIQGELILRKTAKQISNDDNAVFINMPVHYKKNRSEIDMLVVSRAGILIVEVKNHSGMIIGQSHEEQWIQRKFYKDGKITDKQIKNPYKQIGKQREILKSILRTDNLDVWVDNILYFANPKVKVKVEMQRDEFVFSNKAALDEFISEYEKRTPKIDEEKVKLIVDKLSKLK